jgi:hypothetical protein
MLMVVLRCGLESALDPSKRPHLLSLVYIHIRILITY